jgi:hypothetical protein
LVGCKYAYTEELGLLWVPDHINIFLIFLTIGIIGIDTCMVTFTCNVTTVGTSKSK